VTAVDVPFLDLAAITALQRDEIDLAWKSVLEHGRFVGGSKVETFEAAFASYCETEHCVGVGNGTDALELILSGLGIGPGDEVILPANTFIATAEAVCAVGARPRFVDVLPDTLQIDPDAALAAAGPRTAAIIAVHMFGQMVDVPRIVAAAHRLGVALIEDGEPAASASRPGAASTRARISVLSATAAPSSPRTPT
jgi:dTDP-4-amino-4,6-dideoxygalactose transaminase